MESVRVSPANADEGRNRSRDRDRDWDEGRSQSECRGWDGSRNRGVRVAIRADAGPKVGMGHAIRMSALADALREQGAVCDVFFGDSEPIDYSSYDVIIVDTYLVEGTYASKERSAGALVVFVDDNSSREYDCDILLNANLHSAELEFRFVKNAPPPTLMLLGGDYALLRREFREALAEANETVNETVEAAVKGAVGEAGESGEAEEAVGEAQIGRRSAVPTTATATAPFAARKRVFVCFGGTDPRDYTPVAIRAVAGLRDVEIVAVLGAATSFSVYGEVMSLAAEINAASEFDKRKAVVSLHKDPKRVSELMKSCDIAITAAGSMAYELAALGLPAISIVQADNQELAAARFTQLGLIKCVGDWISADEATVRAEAESLLRDAARRRRESAALSRAVDKNGADNAARAILAARANARR